MPFKNRLKINDVVLVNSRLKLRLFWILGTVLEIYREDDGIVRSARIKDGDGPVQVHSLRHLYLLKHTLSSDIEGKSEIDSLPCFTSGTVVCE